MAFFTETGTIIEITRGARATYQVRLQSGRVLVVGNDQVIPPRVTLLGKGERLVVTFNEHGRVSAAQVKHTLTGRVTRVEGYGSSVLYQVDLENGGSAQVGQDKIAPHPEHPLNPGAQLEVTFAEGRVQKAQLVLERLEVSVLRVERGQNTVTVRSKQGENTTIRLPADVLRMIEAGERLWMEVQYGEKGERHIVLEPSADSQKQARKQAQNTSAPAGPAASAEAPARRPAVEAEIAGIDPLYLAERRRENHRVEIISFLEEHARDGLVEWYRMRDAVQPRFAAPQRPLAPVIQTVLEAADPNFKGFYLHQALALDAIRAGKHLVIVTQTASGKTLSYNPAIFERIYSEPGAHALYLFPLNALMTDQKEKIDALCGLLNQRGVPVTAARLQGGMGSERQEIARKSPNLLATNPEMLSVVLSEPDRWASFFRTLRYVVIDEVHSYRGIFGVHMSGLVRRLLLTARQFGANPQLILCSATVSNPLDLAVRLTSLPGGSFELIAEDRDGSRQDYKHWSVLNPDWGSSRARYDNYLSVAARVFIELVSGRRGDGKTTRPLNTILFARSIRDVNRLYRLVSDNIRSSGRDPYLLNRIKSYVSAELSYQDKREIYNGLRTGRMVGVISTNALEAGIDIGRLDACIIAGFPFSVMRMRQMAGRVGRQQEGLVTFVPYPLSGLDGYYRDHPELLLSQPPEVFVVDPENPYVARKHINAAALALGGLNADTLRAVWGPRALDIAEQAVADGAMRRVNGNSPLRYYGTRRDFSNPEDVYAVHSIRSNNQKPYAVCLDDGTACELTPACFSQQRRGCQRQVTVLDQDYIYRDCHPGAVYESVSGRLYKLTHFDDEKRVVRVKELPEDTMERTSVEEDIQVEVVGAPRATKSLRSGINLSWGDVVVTRSFTGYRTHTLIPSRACRRCRKEYSEDTQICPGCGRPTETSYSSTKPEHVDFPGEHRHGFQIVLKTVACWLSVEPQLENDLHAASPCKLPGENNRVQNWLKSPLNLGRLRLNPDERKRIEEYHARSGADLRSVKATTQETVLYPGAYGQCLLSHLRQKQNGGTPLSESRTLEIFGAVTGYPVTDDLRHVCRKCQSSVLMEALHTLEHVVLLRYPSVALGDMSDLGSFSTLGHAGVGNPAVFWFDDYEGGLGAAEKIYEKFADLLAAAGAAVQDCSCTTVEGCPRCTHVGGCVNGNDALSKPAVLGLINLMTGSVFNLGARPFVYRRKRASDFDRTAQRNEYAREAHGIGEEAPERPNGFNPYLILRVQQEVHECVARKAFDLRSQEIAQEVPPVSAVELNKAYQSIIQSRLLQDWSLDRSMPPYRVLELQPNASTKMIQQVYHVVALQVHPDAHPRRAGWANEMMKIVNAAYDTIMSERKGKS